MSIFSIPYIMKNWFYILAFVIAVSSCTERMICPAYQSAFIHDETALQERFSYFKPDTTPKIRDVDKSQFLIIDPVAYRKRIREIRTIPMQDIYPVLDDSLGYDKDLMLAERDVIDSTLLEASARDSIHPGLIGPFNVEQHLYMYYFEDILLLPDERASMNLEFEPSKKKLDKRKRKEERKRKREERKKEREERKKEKKGPFSIFKKKNKGEDPDEEGTSEEESGEEKESEESTGEQEESSENEEENNSPEEENF